MPRMSSPRIATPRQITLAAFAALLLLFTLAASAPAAEWSSPATLQADVDDGDPVSVVLDRDGVATAVWKDAGPTTTAGGVIRAARFENGAWTTPVALTPDTDQALRPQVAVDGNGVVTAVWVFGSTGNFDIQAARFEGGAWSSTTTLTATPAAVGNPRIVADASGVVTVVWNAPGATSDKALKASRYAGGTWTDITGSLPNDDVSDNTQRVVVDDAGAVTMIWKQRTLESAGSARFRVYASRDGGSGWSAPTLLSDGSSGTNVGIVALGASTSGDVVALWNLAGLQAKRFSGGAWAATPTTIATVDPITSASVVVDENGVATAAWLDSNLDYVVRRSSGGATWAAAETFATDLIGGTEAVLLAGAPDGRVTTLWNQTDAGPTYGVPTTRRYSGGTWSAATNLVSPTTDYFLTSTAAALAMNPRGGAVALWNATTGSGPSIESIYAAVYPPDAVPDPATAPGAPTGATATAGLLRATVSWTAPSSDGGSAITSYTATASPGGKTCTATTTSCTITGLLNTKAYTFTVTATNAAGTSPASTATKKARPYKKLKMKRPRARGTRIASAVRVTGAATITQTIRTSTNRKACTKRIRAKKKKTYTVTCPLNRATKNALKKRRQTLTVTTTVLTRKGATLQTTHRIRVNKTR